LGGIATLLEGTEAEPYFDKYILKLYEKIGQIGWDPSAGEQELNKTLRAVVLNMLGDHGDQKVVEEAKKRFAAYQKERSSLSADVSGVVFKLVVRHGNEDDFNNMIKVYKEAVLPEERLRALRCIGMPKDHTLLSKAIDFAFSEDTRTQDIIYPIAACTTTPLGRNISWEYVKNNWNTILKRFTGSNFIFARLISYCAQDFTTVEKAKEVEEFFKHNSAPAAERTVQQCLESIHANSVYLTNNLADVTNWLKQHAS